MKTRRERSEWGSAGAKLRLKKLSKKKRREIAQNAANARWAKVRRKKP